MTAARAVFGLHHSFISVGIYKRFCQHVNRNQIWCTQKVCMSTSFVKETRHLPTGLIRPEEEDKIVHSPWPTADIPEINLADFVWQDTGKFGDLVALVCGITGRSYTYNQAKDMAIKFGSYLKKIGAKQGDVMGMVVPNLPEFPIAFLGAVGVGVTVTPINHSFMPEELAKQLENSEAKYIVTDGFFLPNVRQAAELYSRLKTIIVMEMDVSPHDCVSFQDIVDGEDACTYKVQEDKPCQPFTDIAALPYSSGTTGPPKGVCLSHFNLVANCQQTNKVLPSILKTFVKDGIQESTVVVLPFYHIAGMIIFILNLHQGNKIITLPKFEPESYLKALKTYQPTLLHLVPPLVSFLATNPLAKPSHVSSVKVVSCGAAPLGPALIEKFKEKVKPEIVEFREAFGMTESSPLTHIQPDEGAVLGSVGSPVSNTMSKLVDVETGKTVGVGEQGELCVSGPQVMLGYFCNPEADKQTIKNGWLHTGDIAVVDSSGQYTIVDRLKDLIKVKGIQVSPSELEDLIRRHPGVLDVAVIGVPDVKTGESPRAYVIRKNTNVLEQSIIDWVTERAAPHKRLAQGVVFVESLPKNQTGKILRRELKAQVFKGSFGF